MVNFKDSDHSYFDSTAKYMSVTSLIKKLDPTDWDVVKENYAKKHGMTIEEVGAKWDKSAEVGTYIHACFENDTQNRIECRTEGDTKIGMDIENLKPGTYTELIVYSYKYGIAGQIDKLILHEDNTFSLEDYKSDAVISMESFKKFKTVNGRKTMTKDYFKHPLNTIELCNFNKYSLQLSLYSQLLIDLGYELRHIDGVPDLRVLHIITERDKMNSHVLVDGKPNIKETKILNIPFLQKEVKHLLNYKLQVFPQQ